VSTIVGVFIFVIIIGILVGIFSIVIQSKSNKRFEENVNNQGFNITKRCTYGNGVLLIDEQGKKWTVNNYFSKYKIYEYNDLLEIEIFEDGVNIGKTSSLGKAIVGGFLFGVAGAVIGSSMGKKKNECTSLGLRIIVNDLDQPYIQLNFLNGKTKRDSIVYKTALQSANQIAAVLTTIQYQDSKSKQLI